MVIKWSSNAKRIFLLISIVNKCVLLVDFTLFVILFKSEFQYIEINIDIQNMNFGNTEINIDIQTWISVIPKLISIFKTWITLILKLISILILISVPNPGWKWFCYVVIFECPLVQWSLIRKNLFWDSCKTKL